MWTYLDAAGDAGRDGMELSSLNNVLSLSAECLSLLTNDVIIKTEFMLLFSIDNNLKTRNSKYSSKTVDPNTFKFTFKQSN